MKSLIESIMGFFKYDNEKIIKDIRNQKLIAKRYAKQELNDVNFQIQNLFEKRDHLESIAFGN